MLSDLADLLADLSDAHDHGDGSGLNSGRSPRRGPTGSGTASSVVSSSPDRGNTGERTTPSDDPPSIVDRWRRARERQRQSARDTVRELAAEVATKDLRHGRLLGTGGTIVDGAVIGAEGIVNTVDYVQRKHDTIEDLTGHNARNEEALRLRKERQARREGRR